MTMQKEGSIRRVHVPLLRPEDAISHLGSPTHWQPGRSAKSVTDLWFSANALPPSIVAALSSDQVLRDSMLLDAFLERPVDLGDGQRPSQTDLMAIVRHDNGLGVIAVEAKVDETFGPTVDEWLADPKGDVPTRKGRLYRLCHMLGLDPANAGSLRYQLIHRTASAVIEAKRYHARDAAMIVQSFCPRRSWFNDFSVFAGALGLSDPQVGIISGQKTCDGVALRIGWVAEPNEGPHTRLSTARTVTKLTDLGRTQLSKSFFMRDMLYSEVAMIHGLNNAPDNPDLAIEAGKRLCEELLEPLQDHWGRIAIRSAYRSCEVNGFCNSMQRKKKAGYTCASNESNFAGHIWDRLDANGQMGAMACVVVPSFWAKHNEQGDWRILARWIHQNLPYSTLYFFPTYWAFNIGWHENPERSIKSYAEPAGTFMP